MDAKEEPIPFFSDGNEDPFAQFKPAYKAALSSPGNSLEALSSDDPQRSSASPSRAGAISPSKTPTPGTVSSMSMSKSSPPPKPIVSPAKNVVVASPSNGMVKLPTADSLFQDDSLGDSGNNFFDAFAGTGSSGGNTVISNGNHAKVESKAVKPRSKADDFEEIAPVQQPAYSMDYSTFAPQTKAISEYSMDYSKFATSEQHEDLHEDVEDVPDYTTQQPLPTYSNNYYFSSDNLNVAASDITSTAAPLNQTSNNSASQYQAQQYVANHDVNGGGYQTSDYQANTYIQPNTQAYSITGNQQSYIDQGSYSVTNTYVPPTEKSAPIAQEYQQPVVYPSFNEPSVQVTSPAKISPVAQQNQFSNHSQKVSPDDRRSVTSGGSKSSAHHHPSVPRQVVPDYAQTLPVQTAVPSYTSPQYIAPQQTEYQGSYSNVYTAAEADQGTQPQNYYQNNGYEQQALGYVSPPISSNGDISGLDPAAKYSTVHGKNSRRRRSLIVPANTNKSAEDQSLGISRSNSAILKEVTSKPPSAVDNHPLAATLNVRKNRMSPRPQSEFVAHNTTMYQGAAGNWNGLDPAILSNRTGAISVAEDDRSSVMSYRSNYNDCKQCLACSKYNEIDANFCSKCGASLFSSSPATANPIVMNAQNYDMVPKQGNIKPDASSSYGQDIKSSGTPVHRQLDRVSNADEIRSNSSVDSFADPLGRSGCPLIAFGSGGKIVTMKPHIQKRYINSNGVLTEVDKIMPGFLKVFKSSEYFQSYKFLSEVKTLDGPLIRKKKKDIVKLVQDLIDQETKSTQGETSYLSLLRYLLLELENDGKLLGLPDSFNKIVTNVLKPNLSPYIPAPLGQSSYDDSNSTVVMQNIRNLLYEGKYEECIEEFRRCGKYAFAMVVAQKFRKDTLSQLIAEFLQSNIPIEDPIFSVMALCSNNVAQYDRPISNWREHVAMLLASKNIDQDVKATLCNLGFALCNQQDYYAGHLCCLIAGFAPDGEKIGLLGQSNAAPLTHRSLLLTEAYESILRLKTPDLILPHLQQYKLDHAFQLVDVGLLTQSSKYCESTISSIKTYGKPSPYFDAKFLHRLTEFHKKLSHQGFSAKSTESSGWMQGLINKIDTTMSDIIGLEQKKMISPIAPIGPVPVAVQPKVQAYSQPQPAVTAPQTYTSPQNTQDLYSRYSYPSSFGTEQNAVPTTYPAQEQNKIPSYDANYGQTANYYDQQQSQYSYNVQNSIQQQTYQTQDLQTNQYSYNQTVPQQSTGVYDNYYSGNLAENNSNSMVDLQSTRYAQPQQTPSANTSIPVVPSFYMNTQPADQVKTAANSGADIDDLGFGNNSLTKQKQVSSSDQSQPDSKPAVQQQPEQKPQESSSGLVSFIRNIPFFRKTDSANSKTANLGEQNSFVYDPVLKKWVNKAAGSEESKTEPTPLAPPPMGGGASLSRSNSTLSSYGVPPSTTPTFTPVSATGSRTTSPMPDGTLRRASTTTRKKNPRNRYVDTLNPSAVDPSQPNNNLAQLTGAFVPPVQQFANLSMDQSSPPPQQQDRQSQ